jgi:Ca2+-transporting ATPase
MKEKPRKIDEALINRKNLAKCVFQGLFIFVACLGSYYYLIKSGISEAYARTFAFSILVISNILLIYVLKSNECALKNFKDELSDNVICFINAIILVVLLLLIYVPFLSELAGFSALSLIDLLKVVCISIFSTCIFDLFKNKKRPE